MCNQASHDELKADPQRFAAETQSIGEMDDGHGGRLVLANCMRCHSTLAVEL